MVKNLSTLIKEYFTRLGVADFTELSSEERATYDEWQAILSAEPTVESIGTFIDGQVRKLEGEIREAVREGRERDALYIAARLENYNDIQAVITAPERNRETLKEHISNLLTLNNHE